MPNFLRFLEQYGGDSFEKVPFGDVDSLILCQMVYSDLKLAATPAPLPSVAAGSPGLLPNDGRLLAALARSARYQGVILTDFVNQIDPDECKQFAAVTAILPDGSAYIAYRGTDNTLVGWKEDFNLAFATPVPAQREAVRYLERAASRVGGALRVGGHSKGGNLAVYAAAMCGADAQERLIGVYNNDGPGHDEATVRSPGYRRVENRLRTILPQSSIIGMLLEHSDDYVIVRSNSSGILQHSPYTWQVTRADFDRVDRRTWSSMRMNEALRQWLSGMSMEKRRRFTDALFSLLSAGDTATFADLLANWKNAPALVAEWSRQDKEDGRLLLSLMGEFMEAAYQAYKRAALENVEGWKEGLARVTALRDRLKAEFAETPPARAEVSPPPFLYEVSGTVAHGKRIGGLIGFPTANLPLPADENRPPNGVYVAELRVRGAANPLYGVLNQGLHPTFPDGEPSVEMHAFDTDMDLYGKSVTIRYLRFLRGERRFESGEELAAQIAADAGQARDWLAGEGLLPRGGSR